MKSPPPKNARAGLATGQRDDEQTGQIVARNWPGASQRSYHVRFVRNGETEPQVVRYLVGGMANAFAKCGRRFPEAKLIEGWIEGSYADGRGITVYAPPSTIRIVAEPAPEEEQTVFDFLQEISLSPKKREGDAMSPIPQT